MGRCGLILLDYHQELVKGEREREGGGEREREGGGREREIRRGRNMVIVK